jgi:hypothetical protein
VLPHSRTEWVSVRTGPPIDSPLRSNERSSSFGLRACGTPCTNPRKLGAPIAPLGIINDGLHDRDMCESQERLYLPDNALTPCTVSCAKATEEVVAVVAAMRIA